LDRVAFWLSTLVTTTFVTPAACAGVVAVIEVPLTTFTAVAAVPPILTVAPVRNPVPVIVTGVPPAVVPDTGEIPDTVGAGFGIEPVALKATICMTQGPAVDNVELAL